MSLTELSPLTTAAEKRLLLGLPTSRSAPSPLLQLSPLHLLCNSTMLEDTSNNSTPQARQRSEGTETGSTMASLTSCPSFPLPLTGRGEQGVKHRLAVGPSTRDLENQGAPAHGTWEHPASAQS